MIIDSHCHLDYEPLNSSLNDVLNRASNNGVSLMLTISVEEKKFGQILGIVSKYDNVYGTYGIHPHEAKNHPGINSSHILKRIKQSKKIIGIGETGLDFYYNHSEKTDQIRLFEEHIIASQESNKPIIIHSRSAEKETYDILKKALKKKDLKILLHCFTGSSEFATNLVDLGAYISASGIITFKKSSDLADTFKNIPIDRILVETDSPYLSPEPLRGKSNEPSHIIHTVNFLSSLKNIKPNELAKTTTQNFFKLFGQVN